GDGRERCADGEGHQTHHSVICATRVPRGTSSDSVDDSPAGYVVGRHLDTDTVSGSHADAVATHPARRIVDERLAVIEHHPKLAAAERLQHLPVHLQFLLGHDHAFLYAIRGLVRDSAGPSYSLFVSDAEYPSGRVG